MIDTIVRFSGALFCGLIVGLVGALLLVLLALLVGAVAEFIDRVVNKVWHSFRRGNV